jgi:hypothetical protein
MPAKRLNPYLIKMHRSYTAGELATRLGAHKNTVRNWQREGQPAVGERRPFLFHGRVRAFLAQRNAERKRTCPPGALYCFRCRDARRPALGMLDYVEDVTGAGNATRRARRETLDAVMLGLDVTIREAPPRLRRSGSCLDSSVRGEVDTVRRRGIAAAATARDAKALEAALRYEQWRLVRQRGSAA